MKKKFFMMLLTLLLVLAACGGNDSGSTSESDSGDSDSSNDDRGLVIGMFGGYTGPTAFWNTRARQGVELAVNEINEAGGINGHEIKVIFADTEGDKTQAVTAIEKLIKQDKADIIFGPPVSGETFAAAPKAEAELTPYIGIVPSASTIPQIGEYVFRVGSLGDYATPMLLEYIIPEENIESIIYVESINNDYSRDQKAIVEVTIKDKNIEYSTVSIEDGDTDFTSQVSKIVSDNPDAVFMGTYGTEGGLIVNRLRANGYEGLILGTDALAEDPYFELGKDAIEGTYLWMPWVPDESDEENKAFVDKFRDEYNVEPEFIAAFGYDAVYMVKGIVEEYGLDKGAIREGLVNVDGHTGIVGEVRYDEKSGEFLHPHYVVKIENGEYVPIIKQ